MSSAEVLTAWSSTSVPSFASLGGAWLTSRFSLTRRKYAAKKLVIKFFRPLSWWGLYRVS